MTRTKLWRLSLAAILGFGWLFLTPAYSDDPLSLADQEIKELRSKVADLNYKDDFIHLIEQAEEQYDEAAELKQNKENAFDAYDAAVLEEARQLSDVNAEQSAVDTQEELVATKLAEKNSAQDGLDISTVNLATANTNLQTAQSAVNNAGNQGVSFQIYPLSRTWSGSAYIAEGAGLMCQGSISSLNIWAGSGAICGLHDNIIGIFTTTLTIPEGINTVKFAGYTDDGFKLYVDGVLATSQWQEQGSTWSPYTQWFDTSVDKTLELQAWWYNGGGPGNMHVGWGHSNIWTGIPAEYLSYGSGPTQEQLDNLTAAQAEKTAAQEDYDTKLATRNTKVTEYNNAVSGLATYNENLLEEQEQYENAQEDTATALQNKQNAIEDYDQAIIDLNLAIDDAWDYYDKQLKREIAIAIAQALANQPQPQQSSNPEPTQEPTEEPSPKPTEETTPEPTPSPEPSPEQTKPNDPTPTPDSQTTDEPNPDPTVDPEPTPEPSPEPSPQPTDTDPETTPEPEPTPAEPSEESQDNVIITDKELLELIPEKGTGTTEDLSGVIANLTSKDNKLVILTPEQVAAVSQTLNALTNEAKAEVAKDFGIKSSEVAVIAAAMKDNPELATAFVEFKDREAAAEGATMPYTLADATTEVQTEAFLADPIGAILDIDLEKVLNPLEWGKDMTDDQREKAQEVVIPVIIASNIVAAAMTRRI